MAGKSMAIGGGGRFAALKAKLASKGGKTRTGKSRKISQPGALAAVIGRKKFGARAFQRMAAAGRRRASRRSSSRAPKR